MTTVRGRQMATAFRLLRQRKPLTLLAIALNGDTDLAREAIRLYAELSTLGYDQPRQHPYLVGAQRMIRQVKAAADRAKDMLRYANRALYFRKEICAQCGHVFPAPFFLRDFKCPKCGQYYHYRHCIYQK